MFVVNGMAKNPCLLMAVLSDSRSSRAGIRGSDTGRR